MSYLNPNNPFVRNETMFAGRPGSYVYESTNDYLIRFVQYVIVLIFGLPIACFGLFLILRRTPLYLKFYRKMLLCNATIDMFSIVSYMLVQSRVRAAEDAIMYSYTGLFPQLGFITYCPCMLIQTLCGTFNISTLLFQCVYRFYIVQWNQSPSLFQWIFVFQLSSILSVVPGVSLAHRFCIDDPDRRLARDFGKLWFPEVPIPRLIVEESYPVNSLDYSGLIVFLCLYVMSLFMYLITLCSLWCKSRPKNDLRKAETDFNWIFFFQILFSITIVFIPRAIPITLIYFQKPQTFENYIFTLTSAPWHSVFNFLSVVLFMRAYRETTLRYMPFAKRFKQNEIARVYVHPNDDDLIPPNNYPIDI